MSISFTRGSAFLFYGMDQAPGKILIVEDDPVQAETMRRMIEVQGYTVRMAASGEQALTVLAEWTPDLIFLDVYLPGMNGLDVLDKIKSNPELSLVRVILISSDTSEDLTVMGFIKEADEFLHKPIRAGEIGVKLSVWMERQRARVKIQEVTRQLTQEKKKLSQYFSEDVVKQIVSQNDILKGVNIPATILFLDIRSFTTISEMLRPDQVADLLNLFFTDVMDLVFSYNGSVNKLIGDALLATFGAPISTGRDARNAVECAIAIRKSLQNFNLAKPAYLDKEIKVGIGIATGTVFAGNIGSYRRMEYTVIGDIVNTASRLQNLTKKVGVDILVDGPTRQAAGEGLLTRKVRISSVRGKTQAIEIFTLDDIPTSAADGAEDDIEFF